VAAQGGLARRHRGLERDLELVQPAVIPIDSGAREHVGRDLEVGAPGERHQLRGRPPDDVLEGLHESVPAEGRAVHQRPVDVPQHERAQCQARASRGPTSAWSHPRMRAPAS
jgi:hypothetical protein